MKLEWRPGKPKEWEPTKPPSPWIMAGIAVVVFAVAFVVTILTWQKGQPVNSGKFLVCVLLIPMFVSIASGAWVYREYEDSQECMKIQHFLCRQTRARWLAWAQNRIAVLGSVTLTPEKELAERMLGLEGSPPINEGKILALAANGGDGGGGQAVVAAVRLQDVLERLVTPFADIITNVAAKHSFSVLIYSGHEQAIPELQTLLRKLDRAGANRIGITRLESAPDASLVHRWLNEGNMPDFCLVIACQLHQQGEEARYSEAAVSMLFAPVSVIGSYRDKIRPQAYCYQPISSATDGVARALGDMLAAQQIPPQSVGHLWLTSMARQARHATVAAAASAGLKVAAHDTDIAVGKPGPASALLAQALAAEMVEHGQGTQLVATAGGAGVLLNLTGTHWTPVPDETFVKRAFLVSDWLILFFTGAAFVSFFSTLDAPRDAYNLIGVILLLIAAALLYSGSNRFRDIEDIYYGR